MLYPAELPGPRLRRVSFCRGAFFMTVSDKVAKDPWAFGGKARLA